MLELRGVARPPLLQPVNLRLPEGACGIIMGASGSGKTVLARAIVDLDPTMGTVHWRGQTREEVPAPRWRRMIGYVPAETGWWAADVAAHFPADAPDAERLVEWLAALGLDRAILQQPVAHLSSGQKQRLALVRALVMRPEALILDEPTGALDAESRTRVEALLKELLAAGRTLLLITHDAAQARRLGTHFWRMEAGRLREITAPSRDE